MTTSDQPPAAVPGESGDAPTIASAASEPPPATLPSLVLEAVRRANRAVLSSEIAARLRRPRPEIEDALAALETEPTIVVRAWAMEDPHFGVPRIVVAAPVDPAGGDQAVRTAEAGCQQVYEALLRDFLASHRCV